MPSLARPRFGSVLGSTRPRPSVADVYIGDEEEPSGNLCRERRSKEEELVLGGGTTLPALLATPIAPNPCSCPVLSRLPDQSAPGRRPGASRGPGACDPKGSIVLRGKSPRCAVFPCSPAEHAAKSRRSVRGGAGLARGGREGREAQLSLRLRRIRRLEACRILRE